VYRAGERYFLKLESSDKEVFTCVGPHEIELLRSMVKLIFNKSARNHPQLQTRLRATVRNTVHYSKEERDNIMPVLPGRLFVTVLESILQQHSVFHSTHWPGTSKST
jgi:hypothetical protein